jgi:hypothetical protein
LAREWGRLALELDLDGVKGVPDYQLCYTTDCPGSQVLRYIPHLQDSWKYEFELFKG